MASAIYRNRCDNAPCRGRHSWRPALCLSTRSEHHRRGRRPRRPAYRLLTRPEHRRTGRRPRRPMPRLTDMYRFIGPVFVPPRTTGGHMGPPLRGMWNVIPFNRHWILSQRGSPGTATPTAFIGGNPSLATRAAKSGGPYGVTEAGAIYRNQFRQRTFFAPPSGRGARGSRWAGWVRLFCRFALSAVGVAVPGDTPFVNRPVPSPVPAALFY